MKDDARRLEYGEEAVVALANELRHVCLWARVLRPLLLLQVDDEREVVPRVVLMLDMVLEAKGMLAVEGVAVNAADEAHLRVHRSGGVKSMGYVR